jgi:hypothetical protein
MCLLAFFFAVTFFDPASSADRNHSIVAEARWTLVTPRFPHMPA